MINNLEQYKSHYKDSIKDPEKYWKNYSSKFLWKKEPSNILKWNFTEPKVKWFEDGELNITENIFERNKERGDDTAIIWEPNEPSEKNITYTYNQLFEEVCSFANVLKKLGVEKGDRVIIYLPMIPEAAISMLACARIGAVHSVVFAGFSASSLSDRINDCKANLVITSDGNFRGNKVIPVKDVVDEALESTTTIDHVLTIKRTSSQVNMKSDRDVWYHEIIKSVDKICEPEKMKSEDLLFILYTSGSTGKPKGVVHTCAGYMIYSQFTFENVFQYEDGDTYWCTADVGWITGHSYIVYGPLLRGAKTIMFEGLPTYPDASRFWKIIDKYKVNQFYTAPTAIRALQSFGNKFLEGFDLSSLKVIGSVGEPINEEAWNWYHDNIGKKKCPVVDTWWQTETGGIMISPLPNIIDCKPTYATLPLPGVQPVLLDNDGVEIKENNIEGNLCIKYPWPSILRTTYGDHKRCKETYFSTFKGYYFTGDGAKRDDDGMYRILGRVDDVINVSGHRIGTAEVEDAINQDQEVIESAVVGFPHEIKGQGIFGFVIVKDNLKDLDYFSRIRDMVTKQIGPIAKPDKILVVPGLPKTRSGKIMRRILRKIASNEFDNFGDISTLLNPEIIDQIISAYKN
ncbi:MAG: acetate--CoA ligase [Flammeovirgaceae bacterium]|nr:acetate--CoA ligase [Flammeovirgaceae bacterium]|tara:strand:+ start:6544 stop:8427 length:1884 start_codon:yes stop_codon:yes gene_type:complete